MNTRIAGYCFIIFCCAYGKGIADKDQNWPRFRGPNGSGVADFSVPAKWLKENYRWETKLPGSGHSSPVVWGNKVFLNAAREKGKERLVVCVDGTSGKILWTKAFESQTHKTHKHNSYATGTPAVDADGVYVAWGHKGELQFTALSHDGKLLWKRDLGGANGGHGFGVSPIVYRDLVVLPNDMEKGGGFLIGVDRKTGETRWKIPRESKRLTYSTPCVFQAPNGKEELMFTNWWLGVTSVEPSQGKLLWELSVFGRPHAERAISSPIVAGDLVLSVCGFTTLDKHLVAIRPASASEDGKAKEIWRLEDTVPHIPTPLLTKNRLYLWADNGVITCLRPNSGEIVWKARIEGVRDTFFGSPVCAGGVIFCVSAYGKVVAIADDEEFRQLAVNDLDELCRSTPALANGNLYLRLFERLICIKGT
jgi:outer membrane protein assembly factor BamB